MKIPFDRQAQTWALLLCIACFLAACGVEKLNWTEDVLLPDGRIVRVTRHQEFGGNTVLTESATVSDYRLEFVHPDTGERVRYEGTRQFDTIALFIENRESYLVLSYGIGGQDRHDGCPVPGVVFQRYRQGKWTGVTFAESPLKIVTQNLIHNAKSDRADLEKHKRQITPATFNNLFKTYRPKLVVDIQGMAGPTLHCSKPPKSA